MWVARNPDGTLELFKNKPSRCTLETTNLTKGSKRYGKVTTQEFWDEDQVFDGYDKLYYPGDYFEIDPSLFSELTWEDEPVEVFLVTGEDYKLLQKKKEEDRREYLESLTPIEREIINGKNKLELFKCVDRVKRYDFSNHKEFAEFLTINEFLEHDFYTDDGEYEAYLSDGEYFIGVDLHWLGDEECREFIDKNKHLFGENKTLCIYFVDYPEDK